MLMNLALAMAGPSPHLVSLVVTAHHVNVSLLRVMSTHCLSEEVHAPMCLPIIRTSIKYFAVNKCPQINGLFIKINESSSK